MVHTQYHFAIMVVEAKFKIKLFQSVQKFNQMTGIYPSQPNQNYSFNWRSVAILLLFTLTFISSIAFIVIEAESIPEYAQSFYICITELCIAMDFIAMCCKMRNVLQLIETYEEFIEKSRVFRFLECLS